MYMIDEYDLFTKILNENDHFHESNRIKQTHEKSLRIVYRREYLKSASLLSLPLFGQTVYLEVNGWANDRLRFISR